MHRSRLCHFVIDVPDLERGFDFRVLRDPWGNEFCVLEPEFPELLARQQPWNHGS